ncbi:MAG TPA: GNAT family N-acetyltransferase [Nakamurella sp.]
MNLSTERLRVRDLQPSDLSAVHTVLDIDSGMDGRSLDDRARRSLDDRARWLGWTVADYEQRAGAHRPPYGECAVVLAGTGELIGLVGLVPSMMPFGLLGYYRDSGIAHSDNIPEVGLCWVTAHRGRGYASEAVAAAAVPRRNGDAATGTGRAFHHRAATVRRESRLPGTGRRQSAVSADRRARRAVLGR